MLTLGAIAKDRIFILNNTATTLISGVMISGVMISGVMISGVTQCGFDIANGTLFTDRSTLTTNGGMGNTVDPYNSDPGSVGNVGTIEFNMEANNFPPPP